MNREVRMSTLAQLALQDLATDVARYRVDEAQFPGDLVARQLQASEGNDIVGERLSGLLAFSQHDEPPHTLSPMGIGYSDDTGLAHRRMLLEDDLDLARIDVEAARHQHVFFSIDDV
ncbi:MAG: hypothetical protein RLZZ36_1155, partial [Pseudomonadota bacterium]